MKILDIIKKFYKKNFIFKILYFIILILLSLLIAYLLEIGILYYRKNHQNDFSSLVESEFYEGIEKTSNGLYHPFMDQPKITFNLKYPVYIDKLDITMDPVDDIETDYEITSDSLYKPLETLLHAQIYPGETDVITVDAEVQHLKITFYNMRTRGDFKLSIKSQDFVPEFNTARIIIFTTCFLLIFITISIILRIINTKIENIFLIYVIPAALLFCYYEPPSYSWDEYSHLTRALYISQGDFISDSNSEVLIPYNYENLNYDDYRSIEDFQRYKEIYEDPSGEYTLESKHLETNAETYFFVPYLTSALGVKVAQLFHLSAMYYMFFGRLANAIVYIIMVYWGLRKFCGNKLLIFFLALLPQSFYSCFSPALNAIIYGCIIVILAYITYYRKTGDLIPSWLYLLMLFFLTLVTIARVTYGFVFFLLLLLPKDQFKNNFIGKFNILILTVISLLVMAFVMIYSFKISNIHTNNLITGVVPVEQVKFVLSHPLRFIRIVWTEVEELISTTTLIDMVNGPGAHVGYIPNIYALLAGVTLTLLTVSGNPKELYINDWKTRVLFFILFVLTVSATIASMYVVMSPVASGKVEGMQTRYVAPMLLYLLPCLEGKNLYLKKNKVLFFDFVLTVSTILMLTIFGLFIIQFYS